MSSATPASRETTRWVRPALYTQNTVGASWVWEGPSTWPLTGLHCTKWRGDILSATAGGRETWRHNWGLGSCPGLRDSGKCWTPPLAAPSRSYWYESSLDSIVRPDPRYQEQSLDFYQQSLQSFRAPLARPERKTKRKTDAYITDSGEYLYRIKHRNPLGYSGRRRRNSDHEQKILIRVPRSA